MKRRILYATLICLIGLGCAHRDIVPNAYEAVLKGSWRLYETGGSPGYGYFITPVSATPLQGLTFTNKRQLAQQGKQLATLFQAPYYRVDSTQAGLRLNLLRNPQDQQGYSLGLHIQNDTMRLSPACYEGCHYAFVRIH